MSSILQRLCPDTPLRCIKVVGTRTKVVEKTHRMSLITRQNIATRHFRSQRQCLLAQIGHSLLQREFGFGECGFIPLRAQRQLGGRCKFASLFFRQHDACRKTAHRVANTLHIFKQPIPDCADMGLVRAEQFKIPIVCQPLRHILAASNGWRWPPLLLLFAFRWRIVGRSFTQQRQEE